MSRAEPQFFPLVARAVCEVCRRRLEPGDLVIKTPGPIFPRLYCCERCVVRGRVVSSAENDTHTGIRLVPMSRERRDWLSQAVDLLREYGHANTAARVEDVVAAIAAPADPASSPTAKPLTPCLLRSGCHAARHHPRQNGIECTLILTESSTTHY